MQALQPRDAQAAEEIRKLIGFLRNRAERLHDRGARTGGYPIGSGGLEAANKSISHVRLQRSGAWWYVEKANHRLALRCATDHGTCRASLRSIKGRPFRNTGETLWKNYVMHPRHFRRLSLKNRQRKSLTSGGEEEDIRSSEQIWCIISVAEETDPIIHSEFIGKTAKLGCIAPFALSFNTSQP